MTISGFLFDLDGTLAETLPVCLEALKTTFRVFFGRDWTDQECLSWFGPTEEGVVKKLLPEQAEECLAMYYEEYTRVHTICPEPFPGIVEVLDMIKQNGVIMGVVTAKGRRTAEISLDVLNLSRYFDVMESGFEDANRKTVSIEKVLKKWKLPPEEIVYVGDRRSDIQAAYATGIIPVSAAWSEHARPDVLREHNPREIFFSVEEFRKWVEGKLGVNKA